MAEVSHDLALLEQAGIGVLRVSFGWDGRPVPLACWTPKVARTRSRPLDWKQGPAPCGSTASSSAGARSPLWTSPCGEPWLRHRSWPTSKP